MSTIKEIKKIGKSRNLVFAKNLKKADMIHLIQTEEGNNPCYGRYSCENAKCLWITDCQKYYLKNKIQYRFSLFL